MAENQRRTKKKTEPKESATGRIPPHNLEMERALLCSCLIDPNAFGKVIDFVNDESFYDRRHNLIFNAMAELFRVGQPIDLLTVIEKLNGTSDLEAAGNDTYIVALTNEVATSAHVEHYATIVQEKSSLRKLISSSTRTATAAYDAPEAGELIDSAMQDLFNIYAIKAKGGFQPIRPILHQVHEHLDKLHQRADSKLTGVGTGFLDLDEYTSGFQPGDLVILAARPSMGKTAFSLDLARHACLIHKVPVAFFSLEMASMAIAMRILAAQAKVDLHLLRSGKLRGSAWEHLSLAQGPLTEMPFFIDDTGSLGIMELRARARLLKQQHNIGIIFIDYLQLMQPPKADSREQEVAKISRALKGLARELDIPVVALSQLSRAVETRGGDKRPQLADLRDSGAIEQDADVVMFIFRDAHYKSHEDGDSENPVKIDNKAEIIIRKQRNGPTGTVELMFHPTYASFVNLSDMTDEELPVHVSVNTEEDAPF